MAHNLPYKKKPPPDVWGMNKNENQYGTTQSDGIREDTFGPEGPPKYTKNYSNNTQYPPIQQPTQGTSAMNFQEYLAKQRGGTEKRNQPDPNSADWWRKAFNPMGGYTLSEPDSYADQTIDPFQDFKWGMNMPTFQVGKGVYDSGIAGLNIWNKMQNFGLRKKQAQHAMALGDKQFAAQQRIQDLTEDDINFARLERNEFKRAYGGPQGNYQMQDPIARRV